jgi:hypothetical protein
VPIGSKNGSIAWIAFSRFAGTARRIGPADEFAISDLLEQPDKRRTQIHKSKQILIFPNPRSFIDIAPAATNRLFASERRVGFDKYSFVHDTAAGGCE